MPPAFFQKPEAALKRAEELIAVGKESDALDTLHETIKARRHKQWSQTHEEIMIKHVGLCVTLRKPHVAKDALFQYKALTQQIAVTSLEKVITHFLTLAEQKTEEAQKTSIEKVEEIDDLDQGDNPEHLLMSVVSGAAAQDRMDRTVLAPWLRFLWDSYRNCLELLRNNAQVEQLYHKITRQSLSFCSKYQRRTEFRKLCELLRLHLNQIQKHQHLSHVVKLSSPESLILMQDTRLVQLDTAIQMELWQEAYRSAEDVHGMMQLSKDKDRRMVKATSYVNYYDKLALVFWKAGNRLFHAAALLQKFSIYKDMKKSFSAEEALDQATRVLLATLSIPDGADAPSDLTRHLDMEDHHLANIRLLSNLLRLPIAPTRAGILKEAARLGVPEMANAEAKSLYKLLENNFAPLKLANQTEAELVKIEKPEYAQYVDSLRVVVATKAVKQISVIYDVISWDRIRKVIPFFTDLELEHFLVDVSKHRFVKANIDHRDNCVRFGGAAEATLAGGVDLEDADGFTGDDTQLGVEGIRAHLELMYNKLRDMVDSLDGDEKKNALIERVKSHAQVYAYHKQQDYERILMRRRKIENYKETSERAKEEKSAAAHAEQQKRDEQKRAEEMKRLEIENQEIEKRKKLAEQEEVQRKIRAEQIKKMQNTPIYQAILKEKGEEALANMDPEAVLREQRERLDAERQEQQQKLRLQEIKFDHTVRAFHLEEMRERKAVMGVRRNEAPKLHQDYEERRVAKAIEEHRQAVETWERLEAIREEASEWIAEVKEGHGDDFKQTMAEFEAKLDAVRKARLQERAEERKKQRRQEWIQKKADEERRRKEEEERQKQALIDEQRRAARGERPTERRDRMDKDSVAMQDGDWRTGARSNPAPRERQERDRDFGRPPMRELRREEPSSVADSDSTWRSGMRAPAPPSDARGPSAGYRDRPMAAGPRYERDERSVADEGPWKRGDTRAAPPPREREQRREAPSTTGGDAAWSRGQVVKKEAPPAAAPAPVAEPVKTGYVAPHLRRKVVDSAPAPSDADGWSSVPAGGPGRRGAPPPAAAPAPAAHPPRGPAPTEERRKPTGPPPARRNLGNAENDNNWRR